MLVDFLNSLCTDERSSSISMHGDRSQRRDGDSGIGDADTCGKAAENLNNKLISLEYISRIVGYSSCNGQQKYRYQKNYSEEP